MIAFVWWGYGRERGTSYDREYEQEPPTETQPALVPGLLAQGGTPGSLEFTATLFDLIRRGRYRAEPVTTERKIWGGLKTQQVADLELSLGDVEAPVEAFEAPVAQVVDAILAEGPERLSLFRDRIEDDRTRELGALHRVQVGGRDRGLGPEVVPEHRAGDPARRRCRASASSAG